MSVLTVPGDTSIGWHARSGARVLRPGCNPGCSQLIRITQAARVVRQRAVGQRSGKQARQESNLQPPVLERTPSDAGVGALVDFQGLRFEPPTPALLDNAGVGTNPGTGRSSPVHPVSEHFFAAFAQLARRPAAHSVRSPARSPPAPTPPWLPGGRPARHTWWSDS